MSYSYIALGDSLTVGVGSGFFSPGFVQRYRRMAEWELDEEIYLQIFAHPGYKTADILTELSNDFVKESVKEADIITITAGGNDLITAARNYLQDKNEEDLRNGLKECMTNMSAIFNTIHLLKKQVERPYIIRMINLYNPFPKEEIAKKWVRKFNNHLKILAEHECVKMANIQKAFRDYEKEYLSIDGIHPNDIGYERIAELLHRFGYGELSFLEEE